MSPRIDATALSRVGLLRGGATEAALARIEEALSLKLPADFVEMYRTSDGIDGDDGLHVYSAAEIPKLNAVLDIAERLPGFFLFGDDSGDGGLFLDLAAPVSPVYWGPRGTLRREWFKALAPDLESWVEAGMPAQMPEAPPDPRRRPIDVFLIAMPAEGPKGLLRIKFVFDLDLPMAALLQAARRPPTLLVSGEQLAWCAEKCRELNMSGRCLQITEYGDPTRVIDEHETS